MPAPSGLVRIQDEFDGFTEELQRLDRSVELALEDGVFTAQEAEDYRLQRQCVYAHQKEIGQSLSFLSDAVSLCKTILHTGAVTPWGARVAREKSANRTQLLTNQVSNVISFPSGEPQQIA